MTFEHHPFFNNGLQSDLIFILPTQALHSNSIYNELENCCFIPTFLAVHTEKVLFTLPFSPGCHPLEEAIFTPISLQRFQNKMMNAKAKVVKELANPEAKNELSLGAALFTIFLCTLFGANAVAIKISLLGVGIFTTITLRFSIAACALFIWAKWSGKPLAINRHQTGQLLILALIFFMQMTGFYHGQNLTTASHGTLVANCLPFAVMIFAHFFLQDDRINLKKTCGLILGFSGVLLLFFDKVDSQSNTLHGDLIILCSVLLWGVNVVYTKSITQGYHPVQITIYPMVFSVPMFLLSALIWDDQMISTLSLNIILSLLYQSLVTASFGFVMWNTLIQRYGATSLHSFIFIMPVSGVFLGIVILGEPITSNLLGAICFVTTGLLIVNYRIKKRKSLKTLLRRLL